MSKLITAVLCLIFPISLVIAGGHASKAEVTKDSSTFMMMMRVPDNKVGEVEELFQSHEKWMRATHQGPKEPNPIVYVVTKAPEFKNNDPSQGTTGFTILGVVKAYRDASGFQAHMVAAQTWDDFPKFNEFVGAYMVGGILAGSVIEIMAD